MNQKRDNILQEYIQHLKQEKRPTHVIQSHLKTYFTYLDEMGIDFLRTTITEAQNFQGSLTMKKGKDASPHYASITVLSMLNGITSFYDYLKTRKLMHANPFKEIDRIREEKRLPRDILSEDDMKKTLTVFKNFIKGETLTEKRQLYKAHVISELMYSTGARIHEIECLTINDIDFIRGVVILRDSKTSVERYGILNEYTSLVLRIYVEKTRPLVLTERSNNDYLFGAPRTLRKYINKMMKIALAESVNDKRKSKKDIHFTSHCFRHSMASHLLKNKCDIRFIQEILGHRSIQSTQVYTRVVKEDLRGIIDSYHPRSFQKNKSEIL